MDMYFYDLIIEDMEILKGKQLEGMVQMTIR
jgi:hypothetical protein